VTSSSSPSSSIKHKFAKRLKDFLARHEVDGVDLDWEFFREADKSTHGREALVSLVRILKTYLSPSSLVTVTSSKFPRDLTDNYDFANLNRFIDFVNVPAFSFDSQGKTVRHPARLHGISDMENTDSLVDLVLALGLPHDQVTIGVPAHGILYKLANVSQTTPGSPAIPWNYNDAIISHSKICSVRDASNWTMVREKDLTAPYIYNKDKWIGFDDEISIKLKTKYILLRNLGGIALWSPNDDDPAGKCGYGPYPLLQAVKLVLVRSEGGNKTISGIIGSHNSTKSSGTSFVAVIEKYGNVERVTDEELGETPVPLPCNKVGYLKHPKDCSRFYRCVKFDDQESGVINKFQYGCPPGLIFDEQFEICNWPSWSSSCTGSGEILLAPKQKFSCPSYGYFQDPTDCSYFYYCSDFSKGSSFQPYEFKCPFDLAFDEEKLLCNWKWLVKGCKEASKPMDGTEVNSLSGGHIDTAGSVGGVPQGLDGEPDELLEKRSDDGEDVEFVDTAPVEHRSGDSTTGSIKVSSLSKPEGRRGFARALKDAVSDALENVSSKVKSALGYSDTKGENKDGSTSSTDTTGAVPSSASTSSVKPSPDKIEKRQDIIDPVFIADESIISNIFSSLAPSPKAPVNKTGSRRQDIIDPVFIAEESIISSLLSGLNPFSLSTDRVKDRKSSIRDPPSKISGKDHFISIPIIEVAGAARERRKNRRGQNKKGHGGRDAHRPLSPSQLEDIKLLEQLVASSLPPPNSIPNRGPVRVTPIPGDRRPTDRPRKATTPELIPVPILTIRETPRPAPHHVERRPDGPIPLTPSVPEGKPKSNRRPHGDHGGHHFPPRGRPEPEPVVKDRASRPVRPVIPEPEAVKKQVRPAGPRIQEHSLRPKAHTRPVERPIERQVERPIELRGSASRKPPRPEPEKVPPRAGVVYKQAPPSTIDIPIHHQALPSINRQTVHRVNAVPASPRPKKSSRPSRPSDSRPKGHPISVHPAISNIAAQLSPELFANYDIDIKPLSVHPILTPGGGVGASISDFAQLSLLPLGGVNEPTLIEHHLLSTTRSPSKPFGMPAPPGSRPAVPVRKNKDKNQRPVSDVPTVHPKSIPVPRHPVVVRKPATPSLPPVAYHPPPPQARPAHVAHHRPQSGLELHEIHLEPHNPQVVRHHHVERPQVVPPSSAEVIDQPQSNPVIIHNIPAQTRPQPVISVIHHPQPTAVVYGPQLQPQEYYHHSIIHHQPAPQSAPIAPQPQIQPQPITSSPQHPSYGAHYQPQASGSQIHYHQSAHHPNVVLASSSPSGGEKLAPSVDYSSLNSITKNGFKPISPNGWTGSGASVPLPVHSYGSSSGSSHYQYSPTYGVRVPTTSTVPPSSIPTATISAGVGAGKTAKSSLLIIPVPDSHYKTENLNDVIRISKEYPQLFPPGFDFGKVAGMTRTKSEDQEGGQKNDTKSDYIILTINEEEPKPIVHSYSSPSYSYSTVKPTDYATKVSDATTPSSTTSTGKATTSAAPVVIKLELPEGKPDIVKTIVDQVKDTLTKSPSKAGTTVAITSKTISSTTTPSPLSSSTAEDNVFTNKNIPQSLYESIQAVIAQHLAQQLINSHKELTTAKDKDNIELNMTSSSESSLEVGGETTTILPTTAEGGSSSPPSSPTAIIEQIPSFNPYFPIGNETAGQQPPWPYQPWAFQPPVYNPYYPQPVYPHHPSINQTNQYFPYPTYPYGQWGANGNVSNPFAGWYEWAYGGQPPTASSSSTVSQSSTTANETVSTSSNLPSSYFVTITTTVAPPVSKGRSTYETTTPQPTTIQVKEVERITTKMFAKPSTSAPSTPGDVASRIPGHGFDILRKSSSPSTPETPQIQVYIVQGPNGPQVQTKTVNGAKDGQKQPNVQVYVIDENSGKDAKTYTPSGSAGGYGTRQQSAQQQYYQYSHSGSGYQPEESQVKTQTTLPPSSNQDSLYVKEDDYNTRYNAYKDLEYEDDDGSSSTLTGTVESTRSTYTQFLPSSKIHSLQNIYNNHAFPGLRNFTDGSVPESACSRPGLFQHPNDCNKFYECYFDRYVNKFTLHLFECPVKLAFDSRIVGCSGPADPTVCVQY